MRVITVHTGGKYMQMTPKSPKLHFEGINSLIKIHVVYI